MLCQRYETSQKLLIIAVDVLAAPPCQPLPDIDCAGRSRILWTSGLMARKPGYAAATLVPLAGHTARRPRTRQPAIRLAYRGRVGGGYTRNETWQRASLAARAPAPTHKGTDTIRVGTLNAKGSRPG